MRSAAVVLGLAALAVLGALLWHARPVLVWHLTVLPEVERLGRGERVRLQTQSLHASAPPHWPRLRAGRIDLRAPLRAGQEAACRSCRDGCSLDLDRGKLALIDSALPESFGRALATFAPSAEDVSIWRSAAVNWASVEGLAARAMLSPPPPPAFRYRGDATQGIVTRFEARGDERFVAYVYGLDGRAAGVVATSRTGPELLNQILGSVSVGDRVGTAHCAEDGPWERRRATTR